MAFHVDYWNHLGWKDRFSQVRFSQRQHRLASLGYLSQVYTPGFVVNGPGMAAWFASAWQLPAPHKSLPLHGITTIESRPTHRWTMLTTG